MTLQNLFLRIKVRIITIITKIIIVIITIIAVVEFQDKCLQKLASTSGVSKIFRIATSKKTSRSCL